MIYLLFAAIFVAFEWYLKKEMEQKCRRKSLLGGHVEIRPCRNYGMLLGLFQKKKYLPALIQTGVFLLFCAVSLPVLFAKKAGIGLKLSCTALLSGAAGNVLDRFTRGYVVDYIRFPKAKIKKLRRIVFNIADFFILIGGIAAAIFLLKGDRS